MQHLATFPDFYYAGESVNMWECTSCGSGIALDYKAPDYADLNSGLEWTANYYMQLDAGIDFMTRPIW